jgi:hypothetical protein
VPASREKRGHTDSSVEHFREKPGARLPNLLDQPLHFSRVFGVLGNCRASWGRERVSVRVACVSIEDALAAARFGVGFRRALSYGRRPDPKLLCDQSSRRSLSSSSIDHCI